GLLGIAALRDMGNSTARDDSAVVFVNNLFAAGLNNATADTALAYTAAHEAGHDFSLAHTVNSPLGTDSEILTRSDIISQFSNPIQQQNLHVFTRFPLPLVGGGNQNSFNELANDPDIGAPAAGPT